MGKNSGRLTAASPLVLYVQSFRVVACGHVRARELCESRGGRPPLPVPNSPYGLCGRKATLNHVDVSN